MMTLDLKRTTMIARINEHDFGEAVWDSQHQFGDTNLLVENMDMGRDLAKYMAGDRTVLMRGHGAVVAGKTLRHAVFVSIYLEVNAKLQIQATMISGGAPLAALDSEEGRLADAVNLGVVARPWELWKKRIG